MAPRADPSANNAAAADVFSCSPLPPAWWLRSDMLALAMRADPSASNAAAADVFSCRPPSPRVVVAER